MISVRGLRKTYPTRFGEKLVLDGVSFDLAMGERLGILGRNGAGKSTMVRLISGAERPTAGTIERGMSISWPLAFGGAFQPMLTGVDNVRFITNIYAQDFEKNLAFVEDFAELGPYLREPVRTYSSGMRARLAFAISMIIEFDCFLIDEIGAVGDARFHERCNYELFDKRGDRAMIIISHDAAYIREHCNRFAILHDAKLSLFDDFEVAYGAFRDLIGVAPAAEQNTESYLPSDRGKLIQMSQLEAMRDSTFRLLVQDGDWQRDAKNWNAAEEAYGSALSLYPFERSYWTQHAHMAKERGMFERAEISYRTACAHGEPMQDIREHLAFVLSRQAISEEIAPIRAYRPGPAQSQIPGASDAKLFARALWLMHEVDDRQIAALIRNNESCDALIAAMITDIRFHRAHADWISGTAIKTNRQTDSDGGLPDWIANFCCIMIPSERGREAELVLEEIYSAGDVWPTVIAKDGLSKWPLAMAALDEALGHQAGAAVAN